MKTFIAWSLITVGTARIWSAAPGIDPAAPTDAVQITPAYILLLVESLRTNHPALRAAGARAEAATANVAGVRTWENPTVSFGAAAASPRGTRLSEDGDLIYGLEQKLPLFGKPQAAKRVAEAEAATANAGVDYQFQLLRRDLTKALFQTVIAGRTVDLGKEDLSWLQAETALAENRHRTGPGTLIEVLKLQTERDKRADQIRTEAAQLADARVVLNRLLNRDFHAVWPRLELPPMAPPLEYGVELDSFATNQHPRLAVLRGEIQQARAMVAATRRSRLPDVSLGIEGRQYSGDGGFREGIFTVNMTFPWANGDKYRNDLERDRARLRAAELAVADLELSAREEVHHLAVLIDAARRQALLYRDQLIPQAELTLATAQASWEANRGPLNDVLDTRRLLLDGQLLFTKAVAEQFQALSDLSLLIGRDNLEALLKRNAPAGTTVPNPPPGR